MRDEILRDQATVVRRTWILAEAAIVALAFVAAHAIRDSLILAGRGELYPLRDYLPVIAGAVATWALTLYVGRFYHTQRLTRVRDQWARLAMATLWVAAILGVGLYFTRAVWVSRGLVFLFLGLSYVLLALERSVVLWGMHRTRRGGRNNRNAVLVGDEVSVLRVRRALERNPQWGMAILGRVSAGVEGSSKRSQTADTPPGDGREPLPLLGTIDDLPRLLEELVVDEVIISDTPHELQSLRDTIAAAELRGINVRLIADFVDLQIARTEIGRLDGLPVLTFTTLPKRTGELLAKQVLDLVAASVLMLVTAPAMLGALLLLLVTGTRSPIFRQQRVGRNGRVFTFYKFRSMRELPTEDLRIPNKLSGPVFKADPDPRVTRVGRILRRWSLDELPQLLNVVKGEMSLVGPRPALPSEVSQYEPWQRRRLSMRPGMTGLWQVSGRSDVDFEEWMRLDLEYIDNWSILLDLEILIRTIPTVLTGRGAL